MWLETKGAFVEMRYNKIVRDRIPEIIKADQKECLTKEVTGTERLNYLLEKLIEESEELTESKSIEELADVQEVLNAIAFSLGFALDDLEQARKKKYDERGGFEKGIVLLEVNQNKDE